MAAKPTYNELEHKIKKLEKEALEYLCKERDFNAKQRLLDYGYMKRTLSLLKINEELQKEIKKIKSIEKEELERISHKLRGRIKELNCLYQISSFREINDISLDDLLQEMVDFLPPACQYPEITCARIILEGYEITTKNFLNTSWKRSFSIKVHNEGIGVLEVGRLEKNPEHERELFLEEEISLISAIAESISRIVEREWAEIEIKKCRNKIERLIKESG